MGDYSSHPWFCLHKVLRGKRASDFERPGGMTWKDFLVHVTTVSQHVKTAREFQRGEQHMGEWVDAWWDTTAVRCTKRNRVTLRMLHGRVIALNLCIAYYEWHWLPMTAYEGLCSDSSGMNESVSMLWRTTTREASLIINYSTGWLSLKIYLTQFCFFY